MNMNKEEFLVALNKEGLLIYGTTWLENFKRLKELKKYKEMWGEIATMYKLPCYGLEDSRVLEIIKFLEQKYFPEPEDETAELLKEITKEVKELLKMLGG